MAPMENPNWCMVRDALKTASPLLRRLKTPVMSTLHVGPTNGDPERYRITLNVFTKRDLNPVEKQVVIDQARPIVEALLHKQGYPRSAIATFTYGVMYENAERNMSAVGSSLISAMPKLRRLAPPILSTYHLGPFSGEPDGFTIYLSVDLEGEMDPLAKARFINQVREIIESELCSNRYNIEAITSFSYELVCQNDLDKAGGWYPFLR